MRRSSLFLLGTLTLSAFAACGPLGSNAGGGYVDPQGEPPMPPEEFFDGGTKPLGPAPEFGVTVTAEKAPPPISGGTLLVSRDDTIAVAADPDRDRIFLVDLAAGKKTGEIALREGDEPGRVVEDANRRVHVALRRGGAIVDVDLATGKELSRRDVCPAPRGVAYDPTSDSLLVACAGGELVTLPAAGGAPTRTVNLGRDLRDVVVVEGKVFVTRFRTAELVSVSSDGKAGTAMKPKTRFSKPEGSMSPAVAWRVVPVGNRMVMVHQSGKDDPIETTPGGYGSEGGCGGIVQGSVSEFDQNGQPTETRPLRTAVLPVDVAVSPKTNFVAVVAPGNAKNHTEQIQTFPLASIGVGECFSSTTMAFPEGQATALAIRADESMVVQSREPALLVIVHGASRTTVPLSSVSRADTGHDVFHANSGNAIACASCHAEGGDDGRTWNFAGLGPRRTQTFRGGLTGSEPFHWDGDMKNLSVLMTKVFVGRMSGPALRDDQVTALSGWVDHIPELPRSAPTDPAAAARGKALFEDSTVACASCHGGPRLGSNASADVGTGGVLQVPSLRGLSFRAPFLHTGCAPTLIARFGTCGGGDQHGKTSHLTTAQLADLVSYLETL